LELLQIDLFGPVSTASIYGSKYGLVIVDDCSRWSWVKFFKSKDDSYDVFSKFCIQIQSEKELKILTRIEPFEIFCEKHGITVSHLKYFVKNMELSMNSHLLELHNKMGL